MDFELFRDLPDRGKCCHIKNFVTYLSTRKIENRWVNLYAIDGNYPEVVFRLADNTIMKVNPFVDVVYLESYSQKISIEELELNHQ